MGGGAEVFASEGESGALARGNERAMVPTRTNIPRIKNLGQR